MLHNIFWLILTNLRRRLFFSILFFIMAFFISGELFLVLISLTLLGFPEYEGLKVFFFTIGFSSLIFSLALLIAVSIFFGNTKREEFLVYRIFGINLYDILFTSLLEVCTIVLAGAIAGVLVILLLIKIKVILIPYFFDNIARFKTFKLISVSGQTITAVLALTAFFSLISFIRILRKIKYRSIRGIW